MRRSRRYSGRKRHRRGSRRAGRKTNYMSFKKYRGTKRLNFATQSRGGFQF